MEINLMNELKRFFKNNYRKIIAGAVIVAVLYSAFQMVSIFLDQREDVLQSEEQEQKIADPGVFKFYLETDDGRTYANFAIIEEYFLLPSTLKAVERQTQTQIIELLEAQELNEFVKTTENRGVLGISRDAASGVFTFKVNVGSARDNLRVANFYFDYLQSDEIPVLDDKNVYVIEEPYLAELTEQEANELLLPEKINTPFRIIKNSLINLVIGMIFGLVLVTFILVLKTILGKKTAYSFAYNWDMNEFHMIVNDEEDMKNLIALILYPVGSDKIILSDSEQLRERISHLLSAYPHVVINAETALEDDTTNHLIIAENTSQVRSTYQPDEVIYLLDSQATTKKWYYKQRRFAERYPTVNKVIQFNKKD